MSRVMCIGWLAWAAWGCDGSTALVDSGGAGDAASAATDGGGPRADSGSAGPDGGADDAGAPDRPSGCTGLVAPSPVPDPGTRDLAAIVRAHPEGGVVWLPDGTYEKGVLSSFTPARPLVLVAEHPGQVVVTRSDDVVGETSMSLRDVHRVGFVGLRFERVTVELTDSSDLAFWYTEHRVPAATHTEARRKLCGGGRSPDGFLIRGSDRVRLFGVTIDDVGHDGIKIGSSDDVTVVGATMTDIYHFGYQTQTTAADAASCGHSPDDRFHHSDAIQIHPGDVNRLIVSDSYTDRHFMWQVSGSGGSCRGLRVQRTVFEPQRGTCHAINTRVKQSASSSAEMDITVLDTTVYCDGMSPPSRWQLITNNTRCPNHRVRVEDVQFVDTAAPAPNPAELWRAAHPVACWPCFLSEDVGWGDFDAACVDPTGFPSFTRMDDSGAAPFDQHACMGVY